MRFYEFNEFGYYALIGSKSEKEAIEFYVETVTDMDENCGELDEITEELARAKLKNIYESEEEKERERAMKEFDECIEQEETYLVLIDGCLI